MKKDFNLININNSQVSTISLDVNDSFEGAYTDSNISYVVRWQLARRRAGTAKVKAMSEISGTTAKPWKQKGTGRARQGSRRSVQFVGGRTCHGPTPRTFDFSIPKKIVKKALSDSFLVKVKQNSVMVFDYSSIDNLKSSYVKSVLNLLKIESALFVTDGEKKEFNEISKATRNIKGIKTLDLKSLNVYDLLKYQYLIVDTDSFIKISQLKQGE